MDGPKKPHQASKDWVVGAAVIVAVGLVAAIAWTTYRAKRLARSQDMAVIGDLRQIGAAADQYHLEHNSRPSPA